MNFLIILQFISCALLVEGRIGVRIGLLFTKEVCSEVNEGVFQTTMVSRFLDFVSGERDYVDGNCHDQCEDLCSENGYEDRTTSNQICRCIKPKKKHTCEDIPPPCKDDETCVQDTENTIKCVAANVTTDSCENSDYGNLENCPSEKPQVDGDCEASDNLCRYCEITSEVKTYTKCRCFGMWACVQSDSIDVLELPSDEQLESDSKL